MKTFKEFLLEQETEEEKYRKIIKLKLPKKTSAYTYPIGVGGAYYGVSNPPSGEASGGSE